MKQPERTSLICSLNRNEDMCTLGPCQCCGWSYVEIERRKKLPLVEFPNGLFGKIVTKQRTVEKEN